MEVTVTAELSEAVLRHWLVKIWCDFLPFGSIARARARHFWYAEDYRHPREHTTCHVLTFAAADAPWLQIVPVPLALLSGL